MKISSNHLFYLGSHSENVKLAQLRMNCSKLNAHLFSLHVVDSPKCVCGCAVEDTSHFLMKCPLYHIDKVYFKLCTIMEYMILMYHYYYTEVMTTAFC